MAGATVLTWFPFHFAKHLKETMTLDTLAQGALLMLTAHYYSTLTAPRDNDRTLASITKMPLADWIERRQDFLDLRHEDGTPFFQIVDGSWQNAYIEAEIADASSKHAARSAHAKAAADAKYGRKSPGDAPGKPAAAPSRAPRTKRAPAIPDALPPASPEHTSPHSSGDTQEQVQLTLSTERVNRASAPNDDATGKAISDRLKGPEPQAPAIGMQGLLGTVLPEDWVPDDQDIACAKEYGMSLDDIQAELLKFHALNSQNGTYSKNWKATWQLFCARFKERRDAAPKRAAPRVEVNNELFTPDAATWERSCSVWIKDQSKWSFKSLGPEPGQPNCRCPRAILEKYHIDPATGLYRTPADPEVKAAAS